MVPGVLIICHGSRDSSWVTLVEEAVSRLSLKRKLPVEVSFLELVEGRLIQNGIDRLEEAGVTDIIVIPLFVSSGSTHVDEIAYALGVKAEPDCDTDLVPFRVAARIHYGEPADDDPDIAVMLWDKVKGLSLAPEREMVLLVGHGSRHDGFRQRWEAGMSSLAERVRKLSRLAAADFGLISLGTVRRRAEHWRKLGYDVLVAPVFLSEGYFTKVVIPDRLKGLDYAYTGDTLLPHPLLPHWIERQVNAMVEALEGEQG
ncbi:sirohydrochlorin chelatase [Paenibacillus sp. NFR01]|uniref:sirohydrochlorin chelatase n=1 Tax=Paenibacillus sp. NFR01 TaxID=1566279 RepID=UPI0008B6F8C6|nr:CbiX/SirB N-terminal domain-containing protein [Paenibacillus sp. NFR01]SEU27454.1 Sirohydrochlorin ferrochelatase [Paenibacillus sp. NFR01]